MTRSVIAPIKISHHPARVKFFFPFFLQQVMLDDLTDKITEFEDFVQSVDIAAMQKI
jgi:hypothetical protein